MSDPLEVRNPWAVPHLDEYLFYCCPECELRTKEYEAFYSHALNVHELAKQTLQPTSKLCAPFFCGDGHLQHLAQLKSGPSREEKNPRIENSGVVHLQVAKMLPQKIFQCR